MVIENNILAALPAVGVALQLSCPSDAGPSQVASFRSNLLLSGLPAQTLMHFDNSCPTLVYKTVDAVTAELLALDPVATVSENLTLAPSCTTGDGGTDSGCLVTPACTSPTACLSTLFAGWDNGTLGYANLVSPAAFAGTCPPTSPSGTPVEGWPLAPTAPCAVARSTLDDNATVTTDLDGNCRNTGTPSMGAAESAADAPDGGTCGAPPVDGGASDASPG
jgi:hypothetical protein